MVDAPFVRVGIFPANSWANCGSGNPRNIIVMNDMETTFTLTSKKKSQATRRASAATPEPRKEVTFKLEATSAREVLLAGDFTEWEKTPIKLRKGEQGAWNTTVKLAPGQHQYKFVVDGKWQVDPAARTRPDPFGGSNSIVEIL